MQTVLKKRNRILLLSASAAVILTVILVIIIGQNRTKAEVRIESEPDADVYINGKHVGVTPVTYESEILKPILKVVPKDKSIGHLPYETALSLTPQTKTIVRRKFNVNAALSTTQVLALKKSPFNEAFINIVTNPESAAIFINNEYAGNSPLHISKPAQTYSIQLVHDGYQALHLSLKAITGYEVTAYVDLGKMEPKDVKAPNRTQVVTILTTPTGFLNVHEGPQENSPQIARIAPGREYPFEGYSAKSDWLQILLNASQSGWVSSRYATVSGYIATPP